MHPEVASLVSDILSIIGMYLSLVLCCSLVCQCDFGDIFIINVCDSDVSN